MATNFTSYTTPMLDNKLSKSEHLKKEAPKQVFLLVSSALLIIYGIIFYYVPLVGWLTAFQEKPQILQTLFRYQLQSYLSSLTPGKFPEGEGR